MTAPLPQDPADVTDGDRAKVHRLVHSAWFTANRPNLSWETYAREVAAALAAERAAVTRPLLALAEEAKRASTYNDWHALAARLSAVVAAALGETGGGLADTTAGEAEIPYMLDNTPAEFERVSRVAARRHSEEAATLAARSGGAQDDGLRARIEALAEASLHASTYAEWQAIGVDLRRALAGPDDARQDGVG